MFRFFRSIRKRSLVENKFARYLLYAVGEIALVMVGILLALQVDAWAHEQRERKEERLALMDLKVEFESNRTDFQKYAIWLREVGATWEEYLKVVTDMSLTDAERAIDRPRVGSVYFHNSTSKLNSLLVTGKIDNIVHTELKQKLIGWDEQFDRYRDFEEYHKDHVSRELSPHEKTIKPSGATQKISGIESSFYDEATLLQFSIAAIKDLKYQNMLIENVHWLRLKIGKLDGVLADFDEIIDLLDGAIYSNDA